MARNRPLILIRPDVRFGSKADICSAKWHVRFTPKSDRKSGHLTDLKGQVLQYGFDSTYIAVVRMLVCPAISAIAALGHERPRPLCEEAPSRIA
ncbi:MAG: hypothetical protein WBL81_08010 [Pseudolabrys sp.]